MSKLTPSTSDDQQPSVHPGVDEALVWLRGVNAASSADYKQHAPPLFREAARALDRIESKHGLSVRERATLREALLNEMRQIAAAGAPLRPELPSEAPELWADRKGRKENPVASIRRVYGRWLGRGLTRSHLRTLDLALYQAFAVWMHRHPDQAFPETSIYEPGSGAALQEYASRPPRSKTRRPKLPHLRRK